MAVLEQTARPKPKFVDKEWIRKEFAALGPEFEAPPEPGLTAEALQARIAERLRAAGINPEDIVYVQDRDERDSD